jgi:hypothetical protein
MYLFEHLASTRFCHTLMVMASHQQQRHIAYLESVCRTSTHTSLALLMLLLLLLLLLPLPPPPLPLQACHCTHA